MSTFAFLTLACALSGAALSAQRRATEVQLLKPEAFLFRGTTPESAIAFQSAQYFALRDKLVRIRGIVTAFSWRGQRLRWTAHFGGLLTDRWGTQGRWIVTYEIDLPASREFHTSGSSFVLEARVTYVHVELDYTRHRRYHLGVAVSFTDARVIEQG
jgi:hypothetical protein